MASILKVDTIQESTSGVGTNFSGNGSASAPTISIGNQTNKGFYHEGTNKIGVSIGGSKVGEIGIGYGGFTGNIIQVLQTVKSDTYTTTNTSYEDIPNFFCSITPKYNTSKILIIVDIGALTPIGGGSTWTRLLRGATEIYSGDGASGTLNQIHDGGASTGEHYFGSFHHTSLYLDSPSTISSTTYKVQIKSGGAYTSCFNRNAYDSGTYGGRTASSITLMEIQQ
jgi:hypothetical protein